MSNKGKSVLSLIRKRAVKNPSYQQHLGVERCFYCECDLIYNMKPNGPNNKATGDHIVPKSFGGMNVPTNFVIACVSCNNLRGNSDFIEFGISIILKKSFSLSKE